MKKAVIFDFNGTLFFDSKKHEQTWNQISLEIRNREFPYLEIQEKVHGRNNRQIIDYLSPIQLSEEENLQLSLRKEALYRELCLNDREHLHLVKGATSFFDYLNKNNIPFTIASASIKENIDFFVEVFHLDDYLQPSLIVYNDGRHEDKVAMFKEASENLKTPIKDCIVFEDSISGINNAFSAGIKDVIVINEELDISNYQDFPIKKFIKDFRFDYDILFK